MNNNITREIRTRVRESDAFSMTIHFRVKTKVAHADTARNCHLEASQVAETSCETHFEGLLSSAAAAAAVLHESSVDS